MSECQDIVIIGGGLTGLSAAYYAMEAAKASGQHLSITIVERRPELGGKIDTLRTQGCVIEKGPDSFLARKLPMYDLAKSLGLESELVSTNPNARKTYILANGKLHQMPAGLVLGIPTEIKPFVKSGLISMGGKVRALTDLVRKPRQSTEDESLGHFLDRRLGPEVTENIAEPLLAGIYAGDLRKLSIQATFPQFAQLERKHGSLIKGMMANRKAGNSVPGLPDVVKKTTFLTFKNGLSTIVERLQEVLLPHVQLRCSAGASELHKHEDGTYTLKLSDGSDIRTKQIVVTTPSYDAAPLLKKHMDVTTLEQIRNVSVANVVSAFDRSKLPNTLDGTGFVIARNEGRAITACTWTSIKWTHTSPEDTMLIRCYIGRANDEERVDWPDDALKRTVRNELKELMNIDIEPKFMEVTRLHRSMPQYDVGHVQRIAAFRQQLSQSLPGIAVAGGAYDGVGMPDCITSGRKAGEQAVAALLNGTADSSASLS
ncbi:protoporphyrinogen oxidase [Paenibacillus assamensis]|uniref:protoporphyrinogen oxidase n=1 Tax=Paenibacillus assamensis TaxID=311244 RepID=UPI00040043E5|nr:protoporphyrinogen oxidase [Paenibacillus assamensis]